jgi:hypothetical protein
MYYAGWWCPLSPNRVLASGLACLGVAMAATGCGGGSEEEARELGRITVVEDAGPLKEVLYTDEQIDRAPAGSPRRAFLDYRRSLQVQAWRDAIGWLDPAFVDFVGETRLVAAYQSQAPHFRSVRPKVLWTRQTGRTAVVAYAVNDAAGDTIVHSIQWKRAGDGSWRIDYDSFLDGALASSAQTDAQMQDDPLATEPGAAALRAGAAARRLQAEFHERLDSEHSDSRARRAAQGP